MKRTTHPAQKCTKVNLGSGTTALGDWINIDNSLNARLSQYPLLRSILFKLKILPKKLYDQPWPKHTKHLMIRDVRRKLPFDSASVDYIYTSHLIEHLTVKEAERMVSECYRVLRPGGTIRVVCPDLELMANTYLREREAFDDDDSDHYPADRFLEVANIYKAQGETGIAFRLAKFARHKWLYDKQTLGELLRRSGFTDVTNMAYKEGTVPDLEQLDNRPDHSLHMEAKKPYV